MMSEPWATCRDSPAAELPAATKLLSGPIVQDSAHYDL